MARTCESCGRYLGARPDCVCGWSAPGEAGDAAAPDLDFSLSDPGAVHDEEPMPAAAPPFWGGVRGIVAEGHPIRAGSAGGILLIRLLVLAAIVLVVVLNGAAIIDLMTQAFWAFFLANLIPIVIVVGILALVARFLPSLGGCLMVPLHVLTLGALHRGPKAEDGWDLVVETERGRVAVRVAADLPLEGGEEIVVHGPAYGGRKHAWLVQGVEPPFTRIGRGIVGLVIAALLAAAVLTLLVAQAHALG